MLFKDIIGQEIIKNKLRCSVSANRISHAQMFLGPEGSGNLALAIAYAQYICCDDKNEEEACNKCPSCLKYNKLIHPDLHFVFPVVKSTSTKAISDNYLSEWRSAVLENPYLNLNSWLEKIGTENKQGSIFAEESSEIIRKINMKSYESEYKVMIIWMPEKMNVSAGNKLLKMIEEPPEKTLFFLVAEDSKMMLQTILSRCQLIKITAVESAEIEKALSLLQVPDNRVKEITRLANGNYFKALELIHTNDEDTYNFEQFVQFTRLCYQHKVIEIVQWVEGIAGIGRERQKIFLLYTLRMIRENFMLNEKMTSIVYLTEEENSFSQKFSPFINNSNIFALAEEVSKAHYHIECNANPKILFLDLALKVVKLIKN